MFLKRPAFLIVFLSSLAVAAEAIAAVPSQPATWYGDFRSQVVPTDECPGGTVEQIGERMSVSAPYSAQDAEAIQRFSLSALRGIAGTDQVHEFYFSSELPDGSFWGFGGFLVARGVCVIHVKITNIDN